MAELSSGGDEIQQSSLQLSDITSRIKTTSMEISNEVSLINDAVTEIEVGSEDNFKVLTKANAEVSNIQRNIEEIKSFGKKNEENLHRLVKTVSTFRI